MGSMCWFQQTRPQTTLLLFDGYIILEKSVVNGHCNHLALKFSVCVKERQDRLPTMYYLSFTKDRIKHDLLQTQGLVLQLNFLNY